MSRAYRFAKIAPTPGVNPVPDNTPSNTPYWTAADKVRFYDGMLRKIGGWEQVNFTGAAVTGVCRRIFSYFYNGKIRYLIGTHTRLYELVQGTMTNITPLNTTGTVLGANPLTMVNASTTVTIADTTVGRANGDRVKIGGVGGAVRGVPQIELEKEHIISGVVASTSFQITVTTAATSGGTGGGAGVTVYNQIAAGNIDYELGFGYGGGKYGVGLYGVGKAFTSVFKVPRIWSIDRFGNDVVLTPGDGGKTYIYSNDNATAPTVLTNSPTAADFLFVENSAVCVVYKNTFYASDLGNATVWTPAATNLAFFDTVEASDGFWASTPVHGGRLLLTPTQIWTLRYVGQSSGLWAFELIDTTAGSLSPLAVASISGTAYWVGSFDFYTYDGGIPRPVPNTVKQYVGVTDSVSQYYKAYLRVARTFNEIWLHYPSDDEPDSYVIYNTKEGHFTPGTLDRSAAEGPYQADFNQIMIDSNNVLWRHESGVNDGVNAISCYAETNEFQLGNGDTTMRVSQIVPDSTQIGNVDLTVTTKMYPQSATSSSFGPYTITPTTEKVDLRAQGKLVKYRIAQDAIDETFIMGGWYQGVQASTPR